MKNVQAKRIAKIALSALILTLAAVLLAVPAYAAESETGKVAPFWFTPLGMTVIILAVAVLVVALVCLVPYYSSSSFCSWIPYSARRAFSRKAFERKCTER